MPWYRVVNALKSNVLVMSPRKENAINHIQYKILINDTCVFFYYKVN